MRQLYSLLTFKDKARGEVRFRSKDYIRMVMASRKDSKKVSNEASVSLKSGDVRIKAQNSYEDRPYSYMNGRRDSLI